MPLVACAEVRTSCDERLDIRFDVFNRIDKIGLFFSLLFTAVFRCILNKDAESVKDKADNDDEADDGQDRSGKVDPGIVLSFGSQVPHAVDFLQRIV